MTSARHRWIRMAAVPSVIFAAVVFVSGLSPVSPFASWPLGVVISLCAPAVVPFLLFLSEVTTPQVRRRRSRDAFVAFDIPTERFRWRDVLTPKRATIVGVLGVAVFVSFFSAFGEYRGSPEMVDGQLVFTDHGNVLGPATPREADEARTLESRMFSGHLMLFGVIGLLARAPQAPATSVRRAGRRPSRPSDGRHARRGRPGGTRDLPPSTQ